MSSAPKSSPCSAKTLRQYYPSVNYMYGRCWYLTYCTERKDANLPGQQLSDKYQVRNQYAETVQTITTANGFPVRPNIAEWESWGAKNYNRKVASNVAETVFNDPEGPEYG